MPDFNKLHEHYKGEDSPSPEAQLKWLTLKNGIPQDIAARAMLIVYQELEEGKVIEASEVNGTKYSAGWNLCQYLLKVARELHNQALGAYMDSLALADKQRHEKIKQKLVENLPQTAWQRLKAVFKNPYRIE